MIAAQATPARLRAAYSGRLQRVIVTRACQRDTERRDVLSLLALVPAVTSLPAFAQLQPDDDDEEMVERAKAKRAERLTKDKQANREFVSASEGVRDRSIETAIVPVQAGVYKLAKAGEQLESGDVAAASATLSDSWVSDFQNACSALSLKDEAKQLVPQISANIKDAATAASNGDLKKAKVYYVSLVDAIENWAVGAGVNGSIKGL